MKLKEGVKWIILVIEIVIIIGLFKNLERFREIINPRITPIIKKIKIEPTPTLIIEKIVIPTTEIKKKIIKPTPTIDNEPWGVAKQIDEVTWTMKVGEDAKMATPREIFEALNEYRKRYGSQVLNWDDKLTNYAQIRAKYLNGIKSVDKHEGFKNYLENEDGFNKLGFTSLGENISYGYKLNGVHTIEWLYAGDKPHNDNQLNNKWNYVGIGVDGLATCLIFGTGKF
ncbi:MAG: CAP domain-containing protein [Candidatus Shapirobacteria bacterium]|jgi:hypothetical protein